MDEPRRLTPCISMPRLSESEWAAANESAAAWKAEEEGRKRREAFRRSRIPSAFSAALASSCGAPIVRFADDPEAPGILLMGKAGRGKTYSACAILNAHLGKRPVRFVTAQEVTAMSYPSAEGGADFLGRSRGVFLLAIDDLGKDKPTEWAVSKAFELIDARYRESRPTVITTNLTFVELEAYLSQGDPITADALISRLKDYRKIAFTGEDWRGR